MASQKRSGTLAICAVAALLASGCEEGASPMQHWVYFGTGADHIYVSSFDAATGALGVPREAARIGRPGFLALHPRGDILYAVAREREEGSQFEGEAVAFAIDLEAGALSELNRASTSGRGASHVAVNTAATVLAAVNYGDGNTVTVALEPDGRLGEPVADIPHSGSSVHPTRQGEPHPHSANFTPDGLFVIVPDLGTDELVKYAVNSQTAQLERTPDPQVRMEPGSGPRHMTFHPNGRWAYVINELASTLAVIHYEAETGLLELVQTINTLPDGYEGPANTTAGGARASERAIPVRFESWQQHDRGIRDPSRRRAIRGGGARADRWRLAPELPPLAGRALLARGQSALRYGQCVQC